MWISRQGCGKKVCSLPLLGAGLLHEAECGGKSFNLDFSRREFRTLLRLRRNNLKLIGPLDVNVTYVVLFHLPGKFSILSVGASPSAKLPDLKGAASWHSRA
eukprot:s1011_g6.t1